MWQLIFLAASAVHPLEEGCHCQRKRLQWWVIGGNLRLSKKEATIVGYWWQLKIVKEITPTIDKK